MFIKLDNRTVWNYVEENNTMIKVYGDKIVHTLAYLNCCVTRVNMVHFSIEELITSCGMKVDTHVGKSVEQFRNVLLMLQENGVISDIRYNMDLKKVKPKEMIVCQLNMEYEKDKDGNDTSFFMLDWDNYAKILDCKEKNKINLLNVYCYLIARMCRSGENDNIVRDGGRAECCWVEENTIADDLCISKNTVIKCIDILIGLELIKKDNIGKVIKKNGKTENASNVYFLQESHRADAIKQCAFSYEKNGCIVTNKKIDKQLLSVNGLKGQIEKQKAQGKDTSKLEEKLNKKEEKLKENIENKFENSNNKEAIEDYNSMYEDYDLKVSDNTSNVTAMGLSKYSSKTTESVTEDEKPRRRRGFGNPFGLSVEDDIEDDTDDSKIEEIFGITKTITIDGKSQKRLNNINKDVDVNSDEYIDSLL